MNEHSEEQFIQFTSTLLLSPTACCLTDNTKQKSTQEIAARNIEV